MAEKMRDTIDAVMQRLEPLLDVLDAIPRAAHRTYRSYNPQHLIDHSPRAQAACIYDHMVVEAERRFSPLPEMRPIDIRGLKLWVVGEHTVIRFKKMDEDGTTRNYPTKQARDFDQNLDLEGVPQRPIRVSVGYLLDATETAIERVQIARPNGKNRVDWCAAIVPTVERSADSNAWIEISRQRRFG